MLENAPDKSDPPLPGFWRGAWWKSASIVLLASPLLGFIISGIALFLLSVMLPSARRQWFLKLVVGCVLLIPAHLSGAYLFSWLGYRNGYQQAIEATERGEEYFFAAEELRGICHSGFDPFWPESSYRSGRKEGARDGLPAHAIKPEDAVDELIQKGGVLSTRLFLEVCRYDCSRDRLNRYIERGVLFESDLRAIVLDGNSMTDSDMKLMQAFAWFAPLHYVEINAPLITENGLKLLSLEGHERNWNHRVRIEVLRISRSQLDRDALQRHRDLRRQSHEPTTLISVNERYQAFDEALEKLDAVRRRRAEWNAREQRGDSSTEASK